jgi:predicted enzyme related to lactoylglutathione lyase
MGSQEQGSGRVRQLRLVVAVPDGEDFDGVVAFYRDVLGMPLQEAYESAGEARVVILDAGRATLELSNAAQVRMIDAVETEGGRSKPLRVALEVADSESATTDAVAHGAALVAAPRETPWRSLNARLEGPAGLQLTLFQELDA